MEAETGELNDRLRSLEIKIRSQTLQIERLTEERDMLKNKARAELAKPTLMLESQKVGKEK